MAMDFSDMLAANRETFGDDDAVTYSPEVGDDVEIANALWDESESAVMEDTDGEANEVEQSVTVPLAILAAVQVGATVTRALTGESWSIVKADIQLGTQWKIGLKRTTPISRERGI